MKSKYFNFVAAATLAFGVVACNNDADNTAMNDTTTTTTTTTTTGEYAAMADSARINSDAGNYLNARTGQPLRINVDPQTGQRMNAETGEPVWRYVDRRTWWVYGGDNWEPQGEARMDNNALMYKDNNDNWVTYERRWQTEDENLMKDWKIKYDKDGSYKMKSDDTKIKVDADGETKIKTEDGKKIKIDKDGTKIKDNK
jgi:hypothetical protein